MRAQEIHDLLVNGLLETVEKPGQYLGGEVNMRRKPEAEFRVALGFPDTYSVGMSHLGLSILYKVVNDLDGVAGERVFTPWPDMASRMRAQGIPLYTLETFLPVRECDVFGISLQYEMLYTNVLEMLDLAGIPLRSAERSATDPIVVAGGPCAFEAEPMAEFFDVIVLGDGEEAIVQLIDSLRASRGRERREQLHAIAGEVAGAYVPSFYEVKYHADGTVASVEPTEAGVPARVCAAVVEDLDAAPFPDAPIIPYVETIHDRITLEIMRGCVRGCRFCHAGMTRRPGRFRSVETLLAQARGSYAATGHDEIALSSLSTSDYPHLAELLRRMCDEFVPRHVNLSLSSLRVNDQLSQIPALAGQVRKSGLTLAVEAATERLRRVINKDITDADLFAGVTEAYKAGWNLVKLYFMIGLPTETAEDIDGIADLAGNVSGLRRGVSGSPARVNASVATFVPKPHTPFQWEPMIRLEKIGEHKLRLLKSRSGRQVTWKFHEAERSILEGVLSRGDRRLGRAIELAWRHGAVFDAWDEYFSYDRWMGAIHDAGLDPGFYAHRVRATDEVMPWDHLSTHVSPRFLRVERDKALAGEWTATCLLGPCVGCGACGRMTECAGGGS